MSPHLLPQSRDTTLTPPTPHPNERMQCLIPNPRTHQSGLNGVRGMALFFSGDWGDVGARGLAWPLKKSSSLLHSDFCTAPPPAISAYQNLHKSPGDSDEVGNRILHSGMAFTSLGRNGCDDVDEVHHSSGSERYPHLYLTEGLEVAVGSSFEARRLASSFCVLEGRNTHTIRKSVGVRSLLLTVLRRSCT